MASRSKRRRKRKTMSKAERRAILAPYLTELRRKVPPSVVAQAATMMSILLGGQR